MSVQPPRQLTPEQRRQAEEDYDKINQLGQRYGIENEQGGPSQQNKLSHRQGMISNKNTPMPTLNSSIQGSRYSRPFGQSLLHRQYRIIDVFSHEEYFKWDSKTVSAENFSVQKVFQFYLAQQKRYPTQAFLDLYTHDALQQYSRSRTEYRDIRLKVKKVAQLSYKLFNLTLLEEALNTRLKMGELLPAQSDEVLPSSSPQL